MSQLLLILPWLFTHFITEGNTKFQPELSENKDDFFFYHPKFASPLTYVKEGYDLLPQSSRRLMLEALRMPMLGEPTTSVSTGMEILMGCQVS